MMGHLPLGRIVVTPGALNLLTDAGEDAFDSLARHSTGNWGELSVGRAVRLRPPAEREGPARGSTCPQLLPGEGGTRLDHHRAG